MKIYNHILLIIISCVTLSVKGQITENEFVKIAFYNVENLFDTDDNPATLDDEYTFEGMRRWTYRKYKQKINNINKVILSLNETEPTVILGLCEVENRKVLEDLVFKTTLKSLDYNIIHHQSTDRRGISTAMLYMPKYFTVLAHYPIRFQFSNDTSYKTRDVLYVKGVLLSNKDTLNIFVCHFPSRYGGIATTFEKRNFIARKIRQKTDSIYSENSSAYIIIMGDFNDNPEDESIATWLNSAEYLENISKKYSNFNYKGTLKHQLFWYTFDQIIISKNFFTKNINTENNDMFKIADFDFLFIDDKKYGGKKLFRTYYGYKYTGGFSDHLPVYFRLKL